MGKIWQKAKQLFHWINLSAYCNQLYANKWVKPGKKQNDFFCQINLLVYDQVYTNNWAQIWQKAKLLRKPTCEINYAHHMK